MSGDGRIWYVRFRGKVTGPFDWPALQTMGSRNKLTRMHQVSSDRRNWQNATDVPGLVPVRAATQRPVAVEAEPQAEPEFTAPRAPTMVGFTSTMTEGFPEETYAAASPAVWHYSQNGQTGGPVSIEEIEQMCRSGQLSLSDSVWRDGMGNWTPIGETPEFAYTLGSGMASRASSRKNVLIWSGVGAAVTTAVVILVVVLGGGSKPPVVAGEIITAEPEVIYPGETPGMIANRKAAEDMISGATGFVVAGWKATMREGEPRDYQYLIEVKAVSNSSTIQRLQSLPSEQRGQLQILDGEDDAVFLYKAKESIWVRGDIHRLGMSGTCFAVTDDGYLLTNRHVVEKADHFRAASRLIEDLKRQENFESLVPQLWVFLDGQEFEAKVVHVSRKYDLAILKIPRNNGSYFSLTAAEPQNRAKVYTLGYPAAAESEFSAKDLKKRRDELQEAKRLKDWFHDSAYIHSSAQGAVSRIYERESVGKVIQHTAQILPGNSGGPLVRPDGRVVGINTWTLEGAKGLNYSQSLNQKGMREEIDLHTGRRVIWRDNNGRQDGGP